MGSCCSTPVEQEEKQTEIETEFPTIASDYGKPLGISKATPSTENSIPPTSFETDFFRKLCEGLDVIVLPAARTGITCILKFDIKGKRFILRKNQLTRPVNLNSIQRVMHSKKDLKRIEGQSEVAEDNLCCALLLKTQSCIVLRMTTIEDKTNFIDVTKDLLQYYNYV